MSFVKIDNGAACECAMRVLEIMHEYEVHDAFHAITVVREEMEKLIGPLTFVELEREPAKKN